MIEPEITYPDEREGFQGLRNSIASGEIEGVNYWVTQNIGSGGITVEFSQEDREEDGRITASYHLPDLVKDAYARVYDDE